MGEVWRAQHVGQGVQVAVKVLTSKRVRQARYWDALRNEVQAVAALSHPGIILMLDYGEVGQQDSAGSQGQLVAGSPYLVMELSSGGSLDMLQLPLSWSVLKATLMGLLDALAHAHARGVIHRDIKPANVLISGPSDVRPGLKLTDFGIAHAVEQTRSGVLEGPSGTPYYMAPEQFEGRWRDYGPWTDLYALGVMAWKLACGTPPFHSGHFFQLAYQHINDAPPPFMPLGPVPHGFERWLLRLLSKHPAGRFQRAADAAWALSQLHLSEEVQAPSSTRPMLALPQRKDEETALDEPSHIFMPLEAEAWALGGVDDDAPASGHGDDAQLAEATLDFTMEPEDAPDTTGRPRVETWDNKPLASVSRLQLTVESVAGTWGTMAPSMAGDWRRKLLPVPSNQLVGAGLGLYGLRTVPLVGRQTERDQIWQSLMAVISTQIPRLMLLRGPAGVGKSRLVEWICERAHELGVATVMKTSHNPLPEPADGLPGLLSRHLRCAGLSYDETAERVQRLLSEQGVAGDYEPAALTQLMSLMDASEGGEAIEFNSAAERYALVLRQIEREAHQRCMIVWLDDVQWGSDALEFAQFLLQSQRQIPILVLMTARDEALAERTVEQAALASVMTQPSASEMVIGHLDSTDNARLVKELLGLEGELAVQVEERSAGNPLFAVQLVGDWVSRGVLELGPNGFVLRAGEQAVLPEDIHQIWKARIDRLLEGSPHSARMALELAAVLGREVDAREWQSVCARLAVSFGRDLMEAMQSRRLIQATERGWCFVHSMLRESVERGASLRGELPILHQTCAEVLADLYPQPVRGLSERVGVHLKAAGKLQEALKPLLDGVAERERFHQYKEADQLLSSCQEILEALGVGEDDQRWGQVWRRQAQVWRRLMRLDRTWALAGKLEERARLHGWGELLTEALLEKSHVALQRGQLEDALVLLEETRGLLTQQGSEANQARVLAMLGRVKVYQGELEQAAAWLEQGRALSQQVGDDSTFGRCLLALGHVARRSGDSERAAGFYQKTFEVARRQGNRLAMANVLNSLGEIERYRHNAQAAQDYYRRAVELFEEIGHGENVFPRINLGLLLLRSSDYAEARGLLEVGRESLRRHNQEGILGGVCAALMACAAGQGDWEGWDRYQERAVELLGQTSFVDTDVAWAAQTAGELALAAGKAQRAQVAHRLAFDQWSALGDETRAAQLKALLNKVP